MKKVLYLFFACILSVSSYGQKNAAGLPKLSPLTKKFIAEYKATPGNDIAPNGYIYKQDAAGNMLISVLVKVADADAAAAALRALGAHIGTKAGNIWTVQAPLNKVAAITQVTSLSYIQVDEPVFPKLNIARMKTRVDSVHKGYNLPMRYTGKDVVMGVIDFGFDYNHPTLFDTLGGMYRVRKVWELNTTGTPPTGYSYGHELADTNVIKAQGTDNPRQTHGAMVSGMAAGSGFGGDVTNRKLRGMAFDADMVFVGVRRDSIGQQWMQSGFSDFIDGISYIFTYANSVSKPAVVNISWGSESGPHDGSTLFNQACDNLSGAGKIIVMSAGNEGEEKIHLSKTFTTTDTVINTFLTFTSQNYKRTWVDIWGDTSKTFCAKATLYSNGVAGNATGFVCIDDNTHSTYLLGNNGLDTCYVEFITSSSEFNDKPRVTINIFNKAADSIGISVSGTDGAIDMWDEYYYYGYTHGYQSAFSSLGNTWAQDGNTISTVSDMGAAESVLLVGAYTSKNGWNNINNVFYSYSVVADWLTPFSSRGPYVDGRIKPDITAPGMTIATSVSSYDTAYTAIGSNSPLTISVYTDMSNNKFYYAEFSGTSASAPAASGIVALLLQIDPSLTPQELKNILFATAIKDVHTGPIPAQGNNDWGHGKINAYGAVKALLQQLSVYQFAGGKKLDCVLYPNPNEGAFTLDYIATTNEELAVEITDVTGRSISIQKWAVNAGANEKQLDFTALPKGGYIVNVRSNEGSVTIKTIIK